MQPMCNYIWLGQVPYDQAIELQNRLAGEIASGIRLPTLLLLEHPHVYTIGRRSSAAHLLWNEHQLAERKTTVHPVDRGGDITYHGPGQLVGYPLLPLGKPDWQGERLPQADFVGYLRKLEDVLIHTLAILGVPAGQRKDYTGVWVQADVWGRCLRCDPRLKPAPAKIASIGVKIDARGVSRHGFALNVDPDMSYWEGIIPCGIDGVTMCSLADFLQPPPDCPTVADQVAGVFGQVFEFQMEKIQSLDF